MVDHYGTYDPWEDIDEELARKCRESGGFVMRTGTLDLGTGLHKGDGLQYVMFTEEPRVDQA